MIYDPKSHKAEEFINHEEVLASLDYAEKNKHNVELIDQIIAKAKLRKGLSHREAAVLLDCDIVIYGSTPAALSAAVQAKAWLSATVPLARVRRTRSEGGSARGRSAST